MPNSVLVQHCSNVTNSCHIRNAIVFHFSKTRRSAGHTGIISAVSDVGNDKMWTVLVTVSVAVFVGLAVQWRAQVQLAGGVDPQYQLANRYAVCVGCTSGIGKAIASRLAQMRVSVHVFGRNATLGEETLDVLKEA